jgi:hypothetical protein
MLNCLMCCCCVFPLYQSHAVTKYKGFINLPKPLPPLCRHTVGCCHVSSGSTAVGRCVAGSVKLSGWLVFSFKIGRRQLFRLNCTVLPHYITKPFALLCPINEHTANSAPPPKLTSFCPTITVRHFPLSLRYGQHSGPC